MNAAEILAVDLFNALEITDPTTGFVTYVYHPNGPVSTNETSSDPTD